MTKALITGGSGFIGSALRTRLEAGGVEVDIFDHSTGPNNDVRHPRMTAAAVQGCDVVFHLAGMLGTHELFDTPHDAIETNCKGTLNVLEACRYARAHYVGVTMPQVFPSIYTATKVFGTRLATAYHREYGMAVSHVRAFNAFGPGQKYGVGHPQKIVPTFAVHAWNNRPIPIWGNGQQGVDLIHTRDLAEFFWWAWKVGGDDFTIDGGTGVVLSVNDVAQYVLNRTGSEAGKRYLPMRRGEEPTQIVATREGWGRIPTDDWSKLTTHFHRVKIAEDLDDTVDWYKGLADA